MGLTEELGNFVARLQYQDIPINAINVAKLGFIDCVGVMIAGSVEPVTKIVARTVLEGCEKQEASLFFSERRGPAPLAAWINGTAAHALDFDDAGGHRSAILVPTLLAEGEVTNASGAQMLAAYVAGFEVWSELALREKGQLHERGWHPTGVYGAVAAAASAAHLHRLNQERTTAALAIAASQASGLVANFGSMVKPFHVGNSARAGIFAARLSANGMTASMRALEHERGFLSAVSQHGNFDATSQATLLGRDWRTASDGVSIKRYPTCYGTHRAIDAMLDLAAQYNLKPCDVKEIEVCIGRTQKAMLHSDTPATGLEGKFSIQFAMACALSEGQVTLSELVDAVVQRSDIQALMKCVKVTLITDYDAAMHQYSPYDQVRIRLKSGDFLESDRVTRAKGHITRPLSKQELFAKFSSCLHVAGSDLNCHGLFESFDHLDRQPPGWLMHAIANKGTSCVPSETQALER